MQSKFTKTVLILMMCSLISCGDLIDDRVEETIGFTIAVYDLHQRTEVIEITLIIGTMVEEVFVESEKIIMNFPENYPEIQNRIWNPNLEFIESAYFKVKVGDSEYSLLLPSGSDHLVIPKDKIISSHKTPEINRLRIHMNDYK